MVVMMTMMDGDDDDDDDGVSHHLSKVAFLRRNGVSISLIVAVNQGMCILSLLRSDNVNEIQIVVEGLIPFVDTIEYDGNQYLVDVHGRLVVVEIVDDGPSYMKQGCCTFHAR
ncbi:hypothetical protein Dimus_004271 [Dionaea muscipula]